MKIPNGICRQTYFFGLRERLGCSYGEEYDKDRMRFSRLPARNLNTVHVWIVSGANFAHQVSRIRHRESHEHRTTTFGFDFNSKPGPWPGIRNEILLSMSLRFSYFQALLRCHRGFFKAWGHHEAESTMYL